MRRILTACLLFALAAATQAVEMAKWDSKAIPVLLSVGHERIVQMPDNVSVGVPPALIGNLRVQSNAGSVYLLANDSFRATRLQVKLHGSGKIILLDVRAEKTQSPVVEDMKVVLPLAAGTNSQSGDDQTNSFDHPVTPVALTRYVAQRFYSPRRLWTDIPGISRVTFRSSGNLVQLIKGVNYGLVEAIPEASWQGGGWYITAIRLSNKTTYPLRLAYTDINADFEFATYQHFSLASQYQPGDATMLYLITAHPLESSIYPWVPVVTPKREGA